MHEYDTSEISNDKISISIRLCTQLMVQLIVCDSLPLQVLHDNSPPFGYYVLIIAHNARLRWALGVSAWSKHGLQVQD